MSARLASSGKKNANGFAQSSWMLSAGRGLGTPAGSQTLADLASKVTKMTADAVGSAHEARVVRPDLTAADLFWADIANGLALRELRKPSRKDYDRRTRQFIDSLQRR
jgi:hypothetical protein